MEIAAWQTRQLPRSKSQLSIGTLSQGRIGALQARQRDAGATMDSCRGSRTMQTLRKLPKSKPAAAAAEIKMKNEKGTQPQYTQRESKDAKMLNMGPSQESSIGPPGPAGGVALQQAFARSVEIMAQLRAPGGCPWDREQTYDSVRRYTLEETYEVLDAIENRDWSGLKDELGDLLLQVLFYAEMAQEDGRFQLIDVIENLNAKLVRRHPHVFADQAGVESPQQVLANWEEIKKRERAERNELKPASLLQSVPRNLPALMEASKLGSQASHVGFDWESAAPVFEKLEEELNELRRSIAEGDHAGREEEIGDVLFTVVNLARKLGVQSELALRATNAKFRRRFADMETSVAGPRPLRELSSQELERLWIAAKHRERKEAGQ